MEIYDQLGILSQADLQRLQTTAWPFTVHVYIVHPISEANLISTVKQAITPNSVGIGIDLHNHRVALRASEDMHISTATLTSIRKTGNPFFKHGDFVGGINALLSGTMAERTMAQQAAVPAPYVPPTPVQTTPIVQHTPRPAPATSNDSGGNGFLWFLLAVAAVGIFFIIRRNRQMQAQLQRTYIEPPRAPDLPALRGFEVDLPKAPIGVPIPSITKPYVMPERRSSIPVPPFPKQHVTVTPYREVRKRVDTPDSGFTPFATGVATGAIVGSVLSDDAPKASSWGNDDPTPSVGTSGGWDDDKDTSVWSSDPTPDTDSNGSSGSWDD